MNDMVYIIVVMVFFIAMGYYFSLQRPDEDIKDWKKEEYYIFLKEHLKIYSFIDNKKMIELLSKLYFSSQGFDYYYKKKYKKLFIFIDKEIKKEFKEKEDEKIKDQFLNELEIKLIKEYKKVGWHNLVKKYHPDLGGNEEIMKLILKMRSEGSLK